MSSYLTYVQQRKIEWWRNNLKKIVTVIGARPQFIKAAPVSNLLRQRVQEIYIHTGQHYDSNMSDIFFEELHIPKPDYHLGIGSGSHGVQTGKMLSSIEEIYNITEPDAVIVYGDTNSTLAGALAASKMNIPVFHIEAGLRSYNRKMPEEQNRILTDHISTLLFCPTASAVLNLKKEAIFENTYNVGDVMFDSVLKNITIASQKYSSINEFISIISGNQNREIKEFYLTTLHRAENTDTISKIEDILKFFDTLDKPVIVPIHPRIRQCVLALVKQKKMVKNLYIVEPLSYLEMLWAIARSCTVLTDSGGVQKEAYFLKTPCITLREETEWVETVQAGWNILTGLNVQRIQEAIFDDRFDRKNYVANLFGDGDCAKKIVDQITLFLQGKND